MLQIRERLAQIIILFLFTLVALILAISLIQATL